MKFFDSNDFQKALEYHKLDLNHAQDTGKRADEGRAYSDLGITYRRLGKLEEAMDCHLRHLSITKEVRNKDEEAKAHSNLADVYQDMDDFIQALKCHQQQFDIAKAQEDRSEQARAYRNLGIDYKSLGDYNSALDCHQHALKLAKEVGDKAEEGRAWGNLGVVYNKIGDLKKALMHLNEYKKITEDNEDKLGQRQAYGNLGITFFGLGNFEEAIENHQRTLAMAQEAGDKTSQGAAYGHIGVAYHCLGRLDEAIKNHLLDRNISIEIGDKEGQKRACANLGMAYLGLGHFKNALTFFQQDLSFAEAAKDLVGQGRALCNIALVFYNEGHLVLAEKFFIMSLTFTEKMRSLLRSKDDCKISLRDRYDKWYTILWKVQLQLNKTVEALSTAERGRGQALVDLMEMKYGLKVPETESGEQMEKNTCVLQYISSQVVFVAVDSDAVLNFWVLDKENHVKFVRKEIATDLKGLVEEAYQNIGVKKSIKCDDRSLDESSEERELGQRSEGDGSSLKENTQDALKVLYSEVIGPISDIIKDGQITIVPDGPLYFLPFSALKNDDSRYFSETFSVRLAPSLTSLKLLAECPDEYHCTTGTLLVGDPWVESVRIRGKRVLQLPSAKEEVEMIGKILKSEPLTGKEATKAKVLSRLDSVTLVHIAAHGSAETGDIVLSPNPTSSKKPKEADFLLKMKDVLNAKLRAKLVVLSCCHSGRGDIKAEGVVGIARAFLGAGARSVLVSLWAIDDKATLEFMRYFYQHLMDGNCASKSVNQAMKCMRESDDFNDVRYWAPFVLIGDDVTMNFAETR